MRYRLVIVALLFSIAVYLMLSASKNKVEIDELAASLEGAEYDYFMTSIDNSVFSSTGEHQYRVQANRLTHYPVGDIAILDTPLFYIYEEGDDSPWEISSTNAQMQTDLNTNEPKIDLIGNVVIQHHDNKGDILNIYTEFLTIYPDNKTMETTEKVMISRPGFEGTGIGMTADLTINKLVFLSESRTSYE